MEEVKQVRCISRDTGSDEIYLNWIPIYSTALNTYMQIPSQKLREFLKVIVDGRKHTLKKVSALTARNAVSPKRRRRRISSSTFWTKLSSYL